MKSSSDGHHRICKECDKKRAKQYRERNREKVLEKGRQRYHENADFYKQQFREYHKNNADEIKKRKRMHYKENKESIGEKIKVNYEENKERFLAYAKKYRTEHKEKVKRQSRDYYSRNKEKLKQSRKEWYYSENGREKHFQYNLKRRSYKNHVRFYGIKRKEILNRDNWTCQNCGCKVHDRTTGDWNTPDKAHIDHIIPISKGGHSEPSNLQILCRTCNLSKHSKVEKQMEIDFNTI
jgi:5-methylcytosine-specific restriction endonuclease McrA